MDSRSGSPPPDHSQSPYDRNVAETGWSSYPATSAPTRPGGGLLASTSAKLVAGLVVVSAMFFAFAGGMVFQRVVVADAQGPNSAATAKFDQAWDLVMTRYVDRDAINEDVMLEAALDGMLETLHDEGHTRYLTADEAQASNEQLSGEYVGVGISVEDTEQGIVVVAPIDGSPAKEAGILAGDLLVSVDGQDVSGRAVNEVIGTIRGEEGSQVTLGFLREGEPDPLTFTLTRKRIDQSPVSWAMLDDNVADIRLSQFTADSGDDVQAALREAQAAGAESVILDLRNNPGGYISEAVKVGSTFVPEGSTIFVSQVRDGTREEHKATEQDVHIGDLPLVVLINEGSASSSEIVSGAIKANNPNATIIGETTFGTGTVLANYDLGDGSALLLGTELWLTPEGKLIKNQGIRPDVAVELPAGEAPFIPIDNAAAPTGDITDDQIEWAVDILTVQP
jgi:carboxyl-terminal processing protease